MKLFLSIEKPRPHFAEMPYYLWGEVNYDSEGNCKKPTDCQWTELELSHRDTDEALFISGTNFHFEIEGEAAIVARAAQFLKEGTGAITETDLQKYLRDWNHELAFQRTLRVQSEFARVELQPFDSHLFWGSWKWVGWFATDFTWVGRWIMNSLLTNDVRAVALCIDWLEQGTFNDEQSSALRYALSRFTSQSFATDKQWLAWYKGTLLRDGAQTQYPQPDFSVWLSDLKRQNEIWNNETS